jgi:hypothetical protein
VFLLGSSIVSYQGCGNRLPASTGGAQVTGSSPLKEYPAMANTRFGYSVKSTSLKTRRREIIGAAGAY